jgi:erythrin-vacuolar iron transport family protein
MYFFAPYQLAEIAMKIEDDGAVFYTFLSDKTNDVNAKKVFDFLAQQEILHKGVFETIMTESQKVDSEEGYDIDLYSHMKLIADDIKKSALSIESLSSDTFDLVQSIDIGIKAEQKSIEAYELIKKQLIDKFSQILDTIISEEQNHYHMLTNLKSKVVIN